MIRTRLQLGRLFGIPFKIDVSWLLIFVWVTWSMASSYIPDHYPALSSAVTWALAVLTSLLFFGSVVLHELGHALLARRHGTPVQDITLFIFGGAAQLDSEPRTPWQEFSMALSGPLVSLALGGLFGLLYWLTRNSPLPISALALMLATVNLSLGVFNLIPGFPLDGGRVLRAALWYFRHDLLSATRWATRVGQGIAYGFIVLGISYALRGSWVNGLWFAMIGFFLDNAARTSYAQLNLRTALAGHTVREVMSAACAILPPQLTLDLLIEQYVLNGRGRCFAVGDRENLLGLVTLHNVQQVSPADRPNTHLRDIVTPLSELKVVSPDTPLWDALQQMTTEGVNQLPVVVEGIMEGMLTREDLITFLRRRGAMVT